MSGESRLRYRVMTIDMTSDDRAPHNLDGDDEWQPSRDRRNADDLRNGYVMALIAGSDTGATVRPVSGPPHSEPLTAYRVTVTADNGTVTTDEVVYLV